MQISIRTTTTNMTHMRHGLPKPAILKRISRSPFSTILIRIHIITMQSRMPRRTNTVSTQTTMNSQSTNPIQLTNSQTIKLRRHQNRHLISSHHQVNIRRIKTQQTMIHTISNRPISQLTKQLRQQQLITTSQITRRCHRQNTNHTQRLISSPQTRNFKHRPLRLRKTRMRLRQLQLSRIQQNHQRTSLNSHSLKLTTRITPQRLPYIPSISTIRKRHPTRTRPHPLHNTQSHRRSLKNKITEPISNTTRKKVFKTTRKTQLS